MPPTVAIDGIPLFEVRGLPALSAEQRASRIRARIEAFAEDASLPAEAVRMIPEDDLTSIYAGNRLLVRVNEADARAEGLDRRMLAGCSIGSASSRR